MRISDWSSDVCSSDLVLAIASWVGAAFVTLYAYPLVQPWVLGVIAVEFIASLLTGVGLFLITLVLFSVLTRILSNRIQQSSLGALDRSLGQIGRASCREKVCQYV